MTQAEQVLQLLRYAGKMGVHTFELRRAYIGNPSERIRELRNAGHTIDVGPKERLGGTAYGVRYFLVRDASEAAERVMVGSPSSDGGLFDAEDFHRPTPHWQEAA